MTPIGPADSWQRGRVFRRWQLDLRRPERPAYGYDCVEMY